MEAQTQDASVEKPVQGKVAFGLGQLNNPTPMWVIWIFRTEFVLNKVFLLWLASQDLIDNGHQLKVILGIVAGIDGFVWGMGRFFGLTKEQMDK